MDKNELLVEKLRGLLRLHPDIITHDIAHQLKGLNADDLVNTFVQPNYYTKDGQDGFIETSLEHYSLLEKNSFFLVDQLGKRDEGYIVLVNDAHEMLLDSRFHGLYRKVVILMSDGKTRDVYYFIGVALGE